MGCYFVFAIDKRHLIVFQDEVVGHIDLSVGKDILLLELVERIHVELLDEFLDYHVLDSHVADKHVFKRQHVARLHVEVAHQRLVDAMSATAKRVDICLVVENIIPTIVRTGRYFQVVAIRIGMSHISLIECAVIAKIIGYESAGERIHDGLDTHLLIAQ